MEKDLIPWAEIFKQGAFAIAFGVMVFIHLTELKKIRDKMGKILETLISLSAVNNNIAEQINQTTTKLLNMIDDILKRK